MALTMHGDILLDTAVDGAGLPVNAYNVWYGQGEGLNDRNYAAVFAERGLTGQLHVHRTMDAGVVKQFRDYAHRLFLTRANYDTLKTYIGKICYFMPHYRDDADVANYRFVVLFEQLVEESPLDPMTTYWKSTIYLKDAEGLTVDP